MTLKEFLFKYLLLVILVAISVVLALASHLEHPYIPRASVFALIGAALGFGAVSGLVALQKSYFIAHSMPHVVLFIAPLALLIESYLGGSSWLYATVLTLFVSLLAGRLRERFESEIVASIIIAATASLSTITIYYATAVISGVNVYAFVVGDPFLVTSEEALIALFAGLLTSAISLSIAREIGIIGIDRSLASSVGINVKLFETVALALIALVSATMVKITGFLIVTVSLLIPGALSAQIARGAKHHILVSIVIALASFTAGLYLSLYLNIPVSGGVGMTMLFAFVLTMVVLRAR